MSIPTKKPHISDRKRWLEIIAVVITGIGKFIFMDWLDWRFFYISSACLLWITYIFLQYKNDKNILPYWGFTTDNFWETFKLLLPFGFLAVCSFFVIGHFRDTNILNWHILPLLILYPIWGTIQQFIIVGLIAGNLQDMESKKFSPLLIIVVTAIIFSIVHFPFLLLVVGTFLLALLYSYVYLQEKNLYVLGIYHGWLGALFFYTVLERDPYLEVFGSF